MDVKIKFSCLVFFHFFFPSDFPFLPKIRNLYYRPVLAGLPQGLVLPPILYIINTYDIPYSSATLTANYADDKTILKKFQTPIHASQILHHLLKVYDWLVETLEKFDLIKTNYNTLLLSRQRPNFSDQLSTVSDTDI